jgi:hypothetical protein
MGLVVRHDVEVVVRRRGHRAVGGNGWLEDVGAASPTFGVIVHRHEHPRGPTPRHYLRGWISPRDGSPPPKSPSPCPANRTSTPT